MRGSGLFLISIVNSSVRGGCQIAGVKIHGSLGGAYVNFACTCKNRARTVKIEKVTMCARVKDLTGV